LPDQLPSRVKALASEIVRSGEGGRAKIEFLENYFRNRGYRYSIVGLPTGDSVIEQFLFEKKQGHCEFFASSFALLLRAAGVPCRLVGGYLGGEYNQMGGYYLVADDKAHVWVEAYIDGSGWVRIDPSSFAVNAGDLWKAPGSRSLKLQIALAIDSLNHQWSRSVIAYDFEQQIKIARHVGISLQGIKPAKILRSSMPYLTVILLLVGLSFAISRFSLFMPREQRILHRFLRTVEREFGLSFGDGGAGLFEIASATANSHVSDFVMIYAGAVYHDRTLTDDEYLRLRQILRLMRGIGSKTS
jgi:hypothetical protein